MNYKQLCVSRKAHLKMENDRKVNQAAVIDEDADVFLNDEDDD